jgi:membrane protease YdiL (CAAX protease family)
MVDLRKPLKRLEFLGLATLFEGGLIVIAVLVGWLVSIDPWQNLIFNHAAFVWGIVGTLPLLAFFAISYYYPGDDLHQIKRFLIEKLGPVFHSCRWYDLLYLALLAGVSEELLFRGALQPWLETLQGRAFGLVASSLLFGLAHWVTPVYALLAALTGLYLGLSLDFGGARNLLVPILIHALYDFIAFLAVVYSYRLEQAKAAEN